MLKLSLLPFAKFGLQRITFLELCPHSKLVPVPDR